MQSVNLFNWQNSEKVHVETVKPWKPEPLNHDQWPPDYRAVFAWRMRTLQRFKDDPASVFGAKQYYRTRPLEFVMHWVDTYNPRKNTMKWMPFVFFSKQADVVNFFHSLRNEQESGLIEKCRDAGATWLACGYSVHSFLFIKDDSIGWGSRKALLVDELGNPDSIFEKMRLILRRLPSVFLPAGWNEKKHATYMKFINPENGSSINGEAGDNIGRGGRKAQPLETPILTPYGWRPMGSLEVGDSVISVNGKSVKITGIQDHGWREKYKVSFNDGTSTECDSEHLWTVVSKLTRKNLSRAKQIRGFENETLTTKEISETVSYMNKELNYTIPITEPVEFKGLETSELPLDPYIVGVLLGDGCVRNLDRTSPTITSIDPEIVSEVSRLLPEYARLVSAPDGLTHRLVDVLGRQGRGKLSRVKNIIRLIGIAEHGSHTKFIPDFYKFASVDARHAILQGLMDTDGYVSDRKGAGKICIAVASKQLSDDIKFIVQSLGGVARQTVKKTTHADSYVLTINIPERFNPFRLSRKAERVKKRVKYSISRAIKSVEFSGFAQMRCISVDDENGLYLTNDCIVTHNSVYFVDEAAHLERPEKVEAALGDNTNVRIEISSVNGVGNPFHKRRVSGVEWRPGVRFEPGYTRVMVVDWRDHPEKTQEWYDLRRAKYEREGMLHLFAQEVDRDYSAAVSNTIIPKQYIMAAVDAHVKLGWTAEQIGNNWLAGLDVADGGVDRNGLVVRQGLVCRSAEEWGERDPGVTTRRTIVSLRHLKRCRVMYDSIGVGSSVKAEYNRLRDDKIARINDFEFVAWNAGGSVIEPRYRVIPEDENSITNEDMFFNIKAQAWWSVRTRFYKTWRAVNEGISYPVEELISIDSTIPVVYQLIEELAQPVKRESTSNLKMVVNKQPDGMKSPNLGDAFVMAYFPLENETGPLVGRYGQG